jgi:hypothetical protein
VTGQRQAFRDADPAEGRRPGVRRERLRVARIEFVPLLDEAGDELEARQNATIKEILLWLQQRQGETRRHE